MPTLKDPATFATEMKRGIGFVKQHQRFSSTTEAEQFIIDHPLFVGAERYIFTLKYPSQLPKKIVDEELLKVVWIILTEGHAPLHWLTALLRTTTTPVPDPPVRVWVSAYLKAAWGQTKPPSDDEVEAVLERLGPPVVSTSAPSEHMAGSLAIDPSAVHTECSGADSMHHAPLGGAPAHNRPTESSYRSWATFRKRRLWIAAALLALVGVIVIGRLRLREQFVADQSLSAGSSTTLVQANQQVIIGVDARKFWHKVGRVSRDDRVTVKCGTGKWTLGKGQHGWDYSDANGLNRQETWLWVPSANAGSLIGLVGTSGERFPIACDQAFVVEQDGILHVSINDGPNRDDNDGVISFSFYVQR